MNDFLYYLSNSSEFGIVTQVNYALAMVQGLPSAKHQEIVVFETGQIGQIYSMNKDVVEVLVFSYLSIRVGTKVVCANKRLTIPVGKELLGNVITPLAEPISRRYEFKKPKEEREIDQKALGIDKRTRIKSPMRTGVTLVDMLIPIGKGQKQLILGDRKTGKSAFLKTAIKTQIEEGAIAIYAAIGRKKSDIKSLESFFTDQKLASSMVVIATSPYDSPSLIYLTPYTAMTIAEYFRDLGIEVLLVLDDLSTHARFYREISLLGRRFPGRESYPGDIFYTHARLLERAGNFIHEKKGEVSITCFPVVEAVQGDLTGYIPTNLIGITDGHIFFDSNMYYNGRRPAINSALSVTRVGTQTQSNLKKTITRELNSFFALYEKMQTYSHFGAELSKSVKDVIDTGERIYRFFDQGNQMIIPEEIQLVIFAFFWLKMLDPDEATLLDIRLKMMEAYKTKSGKALFSQILQVNSLNELLAQVSRNKDQLENIWKRKTN